jgi:hypothetical protein
VKRLLAALSTAALIAMLGAGSVFGHHAISGDTVAPASLGHWFVAGNPSCGAAATGGFNLKIEAEDLHVGNYGPINITAVNGKYVDWEIHPDFLHTYDANLVIVKGGPNAEVYQYGTNEDSDVRLTAPRNFNGAQPKYYGISHVSFCFDPKATS